MPNYKDTNIPVYPSLALFDQILSGVISLELTTLGIVTRKAAAARPLVRAPYTVVLYYPPPGIGVPLQGWITPLKISLKFLLKAIPDSSHHLNWL
jgi:hypothetical protein